MENYATASLEHAAIYAIGFVIEGSVLWWYKIPALASAAILLYLTLRRRSVRRPQPDTTLDAEDLLDYDLACSSSPSRKSFRSPCRGCVGQETRHRVMRAHEIHGQEPLDQLTAGALVGGARRGAPCRSAGSGRCGPGQTVAPLEDSVEHPIGKKPPDPDEELRLRRDSDPRRWAPHRGDADDDVGASLCGVSRVLRVHSLEDPAAEVLVRRVLPRENSLNGLPRVLREGRGHRSRLDADHVDAERRKLHPEPVRNRLDGVLGGTVSAAERNRHATDDRADVHDPSGTPVDHAARRARRDRRCVGEPDDVRF